MILDNHQEFLSAVKARNPNFRLISLDLGGRKIGTTLYDNQVKIVLPLSIIIRSKLNKDIESIKKLIDEKKVDGFVIGLPIGMSGEENENTQKVKKFAHTLSSKTGILITYFDERLTTKLANTMLKEIGIDRKNRNQVDDIVSAKIILEDFLRKLLVY